MAEVEFNLRCLDLEFVLLTLCHVLFQTVRVLALTEFTFKVAASVKQINMI